MYLAPYIKMKSKWIIHLNINHKNTKVLEENVGGNLCDLGKDLLDSAPKTLSVKEEMDELDYTKIKSLRSLKNSINEKIRHRLRKSHLQITYLLRDLHLEYIKELSKIIRKQTAQPKKWAKNLNRHFTKGDIWGQIST